MASLEEDAGTLGNGGRQFRIRFLQTWGYRIWRRRTGDKIQLKMC